MKPLQNGRWSFLPRLSALGLSAAIFFALSCRMQSKRSVQGIEEQSGTVKAAVNGERIISADKEPGNWMSYGRTYSEERFSPLKQISDQNVAQLGLAWYFDLDTRRGQEATPL